MNARRLGSIVLFLGLGGVAGCFASSSSSPSTSDLPAGVTPPCQGAELHDRDAYATCSPDGHVTQMEDDLWCCPDGSMTTTHTVVAVTDTPCDDAGATVAQGTDAGSASDAPPACGQVGSGCDSTVCTGNARCTTKYGGCICATLAQQNCTIAGSACKDNGCSTAGGTCTVYSNGTDTGCVCAK